MPVTTIGVRPEADEELVARALQEVGEKINGTDGELVLDFSSVRRINPGALGKMEKLAEIAGEKAVTVVLRGVNIEVYRVLKLVNLAPRFSFLTEAHNPAEICHVIPTRS